MKHLAGLRLTQAQYDQLADICESPTVFPSTYKRWQQLVSEGEAEAAKAGEEVRDLEVNVDDFVAWCRMVGIVPCIDAMKAYAIVQRLGPGEATYARIRSKVKSNGNGSHA